jgi:hypothetical protein
MTKLRKCRKSAIQKGRALVKKKTKLSDILGCFVPEIALTGVAYPISSSSCFSVFSSFFSAIIWSG